MAINLKQYFADTLLKLSQEIPLEKITVRDIVKKSGAGRQTFYNHFKDKNDLIYWIFLQTLVGERYIMETSGFTAYLVELYSKAQGYGAFLKEAVKLTGQNSLSEAIYHQTYNYYKRLVQEFSGEEELGDEMEFALAFNAHGATSMYVKWAKAGCPGSAVEQARNAIRCIPADIKQHLPLNSDERT